LIPRALALALATVILALLLATPHVGTQAQDEVEVRIRWTRYIDLTDGEDFAYGVCVFGDNVAVVGQAELKNPFVVLLRKSDGVVVKRWIGSERGAFYNCISIGGKLYVVGYTMVGVESYGVIYVFDVNLNVLAKVRSESPSGYHSLVYSDGTLYLGGWTYEDVDGDSRREVVWLVEKRVLDTSISLVNSTKIYGWWREGRIFDIGVEPSTGRIWAVGYYHDYRYHSLIVVFDGNLRVLWTTDYPEGWDYFGWLYGIVFDGKRYVYVLGEYGVAKFGIDGKLEGIDRSGEGVRYKIAYDKNYLYIFAEDRIGGYVRHMLYVRDGTFKVYVLSENVNAASYFHFGRPALEGNNIYVAGIDYALGSARGMPGMREEATQKNLQVLWHLHSEGGCHTTLPRRLDAPP